MSVRQSRLNKLQSVTISDHFNDIIVTTIHATAWLHISEWFMVHNFLMIYQHLVMLSN